MAKPKSAKSSKSTTKNGSDERTVAAVQQLHEIVAESTALRRRVPAGPALSTGDRRASSGRFRSGEEAVLAKVLDIVEARPALFSVLAAHDGGDDPSGIETAAVRDAIARKAAADVAVRAAELLVKALRDYALVTGEEVRALTTPAYAIIRASATIDASLRDDAAEIIGFYRDSSKAKRSKPTP